MKKNLLSILLVVLTVLLLASCTTVEEHEVQYPDGLGLFPVKTVDVSGELFKEDGIYKVIGKVKGVGVVSCEGIDIEDYQYSTLVPNEVSLIGKSVSQFGFENNPYDLALTIALNNLVNDAINKGASFVVFPNYSVTYDDDAYTLTVTAVADGVQIVTK